MLIDESYFIGPLTIAQLGEKAVRDRLKDFINRWEPVILEAALGYDFYQTFLAGLDVDSDDLPAQRWLDLLTGVAFVNSAGRKRKWVGFAGGDNTQSVVATQRDDLFIYAGITPGFPAGGYSYTNDTLKGWNFTLEQFGTGTFQPVTEWNYKAGGGWELTDTGYTTTQGERWVIHFTGKRVHVIQPGGQNLLSPLAGFIYYEYMRDLVTQNTGIGVVKSQGENADTFSPAQKMVDAFNGACRQMEVLWDFLYTDSYATTKVYPEWDVLQVNDGYNPAFWGTWPYTEGELYSFRPINTLGI